jgi:hypothetical protein
VSGSDLFAIAVAAVVVAGLLSLLVVRRRAAREPEFAVGDWVYIIEPGSERGEFYRVTAVEEDKTP